MKTVIITTLGLAMVLAGVCRLQAAGMDHRMGRGGDMAAAQAMHDDHKGMAAGGMEMKYDATMAMKPDTMLNEAAQPLAHDTMKGMQKMIPSDAELRKTLTRLQYRVTREDGTEPPFNNAYWDNHAEGIYVDIISGVPLFSSTDKYDSGTGWPSFTRPIDPDAIVKKEDRSLFTVRTEVRGRLSEAHLGHVFDDGPSPTGLRYCMNSAALRFIPKADLAKEGYGEYETLFN